MLVRDDLEKYYPVGRVMSAYDIVKGRRTIGSGSSSRTGIHTSVSTPSLPSIAETSTVTKKRSVSLFDTSVLKSNRVHNEAFYG